MAVLTLGMTLAFLAGVCHQHRVDQRIVQTILRSDDSSLVRNVEQVDALLDMYEQHKDVTQIPRDQNGRELEDGDSVEIKFPAGVRLAMWLDEKAGRR